MHATSRRRFLASAAPVVALATGRVAAAALTDRHQEIRRLADLFIAARAVAMRADLAHHDVVVNMVPSFDDPAWIALDLHYREEIAPLTDRSYDLWQSLGHSLKAGGFDGLIYRGMILLPHFATSNDTVDHFDGLVAEAPHVLNLD